MCDGFVPGLVSQPLPPLQTSEYIGVCVCVCVCVCASVCVQDVRVRAGGDLQDPAGLRGAEAARLGRGAPQPTNPVARDARGGRRHADLGAVLGAQHAQPELRVHQLAPQQRERVAAQ